jgi:hypothetical protein
MGVRKMAARADYLQGSSAPERAAKKSDMAQRAVGALSGNCIAVAE